MGIRLSAGKEIGSFSNWNEISFFFGSAFCLAKSDGRALRQAVTIAGLQPVQTPNFQEKILNAIEQKLAQNTELFLPQYRGLPIEHYYVYGSKLYDMTLKFPWLTDGLQRLVDAQYKKLNP